MILRAVIGMMGTVGGYDADTQAYFDQLAVQPSTAFKDAIKTFIATLKADGNWTPLDRLWLHATELQQHARVSIKNPTASAITEVNSPTWTASQGYTGNASNMYLNTNYNFSTSSVNYTRDSASIGTYNRSNPAAANALEFGALSPTIFANVKSAGSTYNFNINSNAATVVGASNTDSRGFFAIARTASNAMASYKNGVQIDTSTNASAALSSINCFLLGANNGGALFLPSNKQIALSFIGSGAIDQATFYTAVQALATTLGFNV